MGESRENDAARLSDRLYTVGNPGRGVTLAGSVSLASDSGRRRKGLLGVSNMDRDSGLWINPCEAVHTFGMRTAIDVLFLDRHYRVRKIRHKLGPNRISFCFSASSVLELAPGTISAAGTQVNDRLEFTYG